jgi:hypothetical protein
MPIPSYVKESVMNVTETDTQRFVRVENAVLELLDREGLPLVDRHQLGLDLIRLAFRAQQQG